MMSGLSRKRRGEAFGPRAADGRSSRVDTLERRPENRAP